MEISQNFGGEYFYPLNPELPGYKLGTSGFTAVLGKLQRIREKSQSIRAPQSIRAETQRIRTILRIGQNISKVLIEFDF